MHALTSLLVAAPAGTPLGDWLGVRHNEVQAIVGRVEHAFAAPTRRTAAELRADLDAFENAAMRGPGFTQHHEKRKKAMQAQIAEAERREKREARASRSAYAAMTDAQVGESIRAEHALKEALRSEAGRGTIDSIYAWAQERGGRATMVVRDLLAGDAGKLVNDVQRSRTSAQEVREVLGEVAARFGKQPYHDRILAALPAEPAALSSLVEMPATAATVTDAPVGSIFVFNFPGNKDSAVRTPVGFAMPATSESASRYQGSLTEWTTLFNSLMGTKPEDLHVYRAHLGNGKMLGKAAIERVRDDAMAKLPEIPDLDSGKTRSQAQADERQALIDEVVALYKGAAALAERIPGTFWTQDLPNVLGTLRGIPGQEFYREPPRGSPPPASPDKAQLQAMVADLKRRNERLRIAAEAARPIADVKAAAEREIEQARAARAERETAKQAARVAGYRGDIPWSVAGSSHGGTSHVPDERGQQELDSYQQWLEHVLETLEKYATTPEARARVPELFAEYRAAYRQWFTAYLSSHAQVVSSMVAGGSNFPVARMQKRGDAADKRRAELLAWRTKALSAAMKALTATNVEATGGPLAEIERNITERLRNQERYKAVNAIVKGRGSTEDKLKQIVALGVAQREAQRFLVGDDLGRKGVPSYVLQNNLKEVKRLEARLEEEREKAARAAAVPEGRQSFPFDGGTVEYDHEDDRLRIRHDTKPSGDIIAELRSRGFKWSPSNTAWQRQLTDNAVGAARAITKADLPWLRP